MTPDENCRGSIERLRAYAQEAGRDFKSIGIEGRVMIGRDNGKKDPPETWLKQIEAWKELGATHVTLNTMKAGLTTPNAHINAIRRFREATAASW
jgi:hypothetical protein